MSAKEISRLMWLRIDAIKVPPLRLSSEFVRQALLEKLERMSVISSWLKAVSAHRLRSMGETEGSAKLDGDSEGGVTSLKTPKDKVYFAGAEAFSRDHRRCLNEC
jgi:hypothetical protein